MIPLRYNTLISHKNSGDIFVLLSESFQFIKYGYLMKVNSKDKKDFFYQEKYWQYLPHCFSDKSNIRLGLIPASKTIGSTGKVKKKLKIQQN